jgi:hypothetical protein
MLINSTAELKQYIPASVTLNFEDIRPKIQLVEREIIQRIFSKELITAVSASGASEPLISLRKLMEEAEAHLALLEYIPFGQLQFDSAGIRISVNENMKTAFEWQIDELKNECSRQGWAAVESALELLEKTEDEALLGIWQETETYISSQKSLIPTLREFEKFVNLNRSRVLFNKLLPIQEDQQEDVIVPAIGPTLFTRILTGDSDLEKKTKKLAAKALAYKTTSIGFMDSLLVLSDNGPLIIDGMVSAQPKAKKTAPTELLLIIAENYRTRAEAAMRELIEFCQANVSQLTEFKESNNYIDEESDQTNHIPRNDPNWGLAFF